MIVRLKSWLRAIRGAIFPTYEPFVRWFPLPGGAGDSDYGLVRLFKHPLVPERDSKGFPMQAWVWCANMQRLGDELYIEAARNAPPVCSMRALILGARRMGFNWISLERLRRGRIYARRYSISHIKILSEDASNP